MAGEREHHVGQNTALGENHDTGMGILFFGPHKITPSVACAVRQARRYIHPSHLPDGTFFHCPAPARGSTTPVATLSNEKKGPGIQELSGCGEFMPKLGGGATTRFCGALREE